MSTTQAPKKKESILPLAITGGVVLLAILVFMLASGNGAPERETAVETESNSEVMILTTANFEETISDGLVLVDFWATWCPPCRIQGPIIEDLAGAIGSTAVISKLDVDDHGSVAALYEVRNIPTLILFKDGQPVERFVGVQQRETLEAAINKHL